MLLTLIQLVVVVVVMLDVIVSLDVMNTQKSVMCWLHELPSGNQTWLDRNPP